MPPRAREVVRALEKLGFRELRQRGSHRFFRHADGRVVIVPMHPGDLKPGTYRDILDNIGLSEEVFRRWL